MPQPVVTIWKSASLPVNTAKHYVGPRDKTQASWVVVQSQGPTCSQLALPVPQAHAAGSQGGCTAVPWSLWDGLSRFLLCQGYPSSWLWGFLCHLGGCWFSHCCGGSPTWEALLRERQTVWWAVQAADGESLLRQGAWEDYAHAMSLSFPLQDIFIHARGHKAEVMCSH